MVKKTGLLRQKRLSYMMVILEFLLAIAIALFFIASIIGDYTSVPNIVSYSILLSLCIPLGLIIYFKSQEKAIRILATGLLCTVTLFIVSGIVWYILPLWSANPAFPAAGMLIMVAGYVPLIAALYRVLRNAGLTVGTGAQSFIVGAVAIYAVIVFTVTFAMSSREPGDLYSSAIFATASLADIVIISLCVINLYSHKNDEARFLFASIAGMILFSLMGDGSNLVGSMGVIEAWNFSQIFYALSFITQTIGLLIFSMQIVNTENISRVNKELYDTRRMVEDFVAQTPDGVCMADSGGRVAMVNDTFRGLFGKSRQGAWDEADLFSSPSVLGDEAYARLLEVREKGVKQSFMVRLGPEAATYVNVRIFPMLSPDGEVSSYVLIAEDVTEKENAVQDLKKSRALYRAVVDDQTELICRFKGDGSITFANQAYWRYFYPDGKPRPDGNFYDSLGEAGRSEACRIISALSPSAEVATALIRTPATGGVRWTQWTLRAIYGPQGEFIEYQSVGRDITGLKDAEDALKRANDELEARVMERTSELARSNEALHHEIEEHTKDEERIKASLREKEILLKEIHHRVKNNLQIISSLLNLQMGRVRETESIEALRESQSRVRSIALIHEKLYQSEDLAMIDFPQYVHNLIFYLQKTYSPLSGDVRLNIDVDDVRLDIDRAIPCGLIINELVTNSFKYAFPGNASGEIYVGLHVSGEGKAHLEVMDTGRGLPDGLDVRNTETLGLQLVNILVEQLQGRLNVRGSPGARFSITFATA
jgi:PAS domain S-box-containing protein